MAWLCSIISDNKVASFSCKVTSLKDRILMFKSTLSCSVISFSEMNFSIHFLKWSSLKGLSWSLQISDSFAAIFLSNRTSTNFIQIIWLSLYFSSYWRVWRASSVASYFEKLTMLRYQPGNQINYSSFSLQATSRDLIVLKPIGVVSVS